MRGRSALLLVSILIVLAASGVVVRWWLQRGADTVAAGLPVADVSPRVAAPRVVASMGQAELLSAARRALAEHRLLAPAGDNAFGYYLKVLEHDPHNRVAADALREVFPFAAQVAEQTINESSLDEATRQIDLLGRADPANYTLTILRAKLDARRKLEEGIAGKDPLGSGGHGANVVRVTAPASQTANAGLAASAKPETPPVAAGPEIAKVSTEPSPGRVDEAPAPTPPTPPLLVRQVRPAYPTPARRAHRQGWVDVEYTVDAQGKVTDAKVVDARPTHVFDVAALTAVRRWEYRPARRDGHAVPQRVRSRVEFHL